MYFSEWELEEDKSYYQTIASFKELTSPFFKVRVIPKELENVFYIMIRDYKTGVLLFSRTFVMIKNNKTVFINLRQAKVYAEALAQVCLEDLTMVV